MRAPEAVSINGRRGEAIRAKTGPLVARTRAMRAGGVRTNTGPYPPYEATWAEPGPLWRRTVVPAPGSDSGIRQKWVRTGKLRFKGELSREGGRVTVARLRPQAGNLAPLAAGNTEPKMRSHHWIRFLLGRRPHWRPRGKP